MTQPPPALAVSPTELRRTGSALAGHSDPWPALPAPAVDPGWATAAALGAFTAAAGDCLSGIAAQAGVVADALDRAARAYERSDDEAARTFR